MMKRLGSDPWRVTAIMALASLLLGIAVFQRHRRRPVPPPHEPAAQRDVPVSRANPPEETEAAATALSSPALPRRHPPQAPPKEETRDLKALIDRRGVVVERGDSFGFNNGSYGATLDASSVTVAGRADGERPTVRLSLSEVRMGEETLCEGGPLMPRLDRENKSFHYGRPGGVEERYRIREEGLEQDFIIRELPAGRDELSIACSIASNLTPPPSGTRSEELVFTREGETAVKIWKCVAEDAEGRRIALALHYADERLTIRVPREWMRDAVLPITVDPIIGCPQAIKSGYNGGSGGRGVAYNSSSKRWLVVWSEPYGGSSFDANIYGQHIDSDGFPVGNPLVIADTVAQEGTPAVSYAPTINRYLVVWPADPSDNASNTDQRIDGRVLKSDGSAYSSAFVVDDRANADTSPDVAYDGTNWYVAHLTAASGTSRAVTGRFVSTSGVPGATADPAPVSTTNNSPRVAFASGTYLIGWTRQLAKYRTFLRTMTTAGTFPTAETEVDPAEPEHVMMGAVAADGNKFLTTWSFMNPQMSNKIRGRICSTSLVFDAAPFDINPSPGFWQVFPKACYSTTNKQWLVAYEDVSQTQDIFGNRVSLAGTSTPTERLTFQSPEVHINGMAWNSSRNTALLVYVDRWPEPLVLYARRYTFAAPPAAAPTGLTATPGNSKVNLAWNAVTGAVSYLIKRGTAAGGPYEPVGQPTTRTYTDGELVNGKTYYYVVSAWNDAGHGPDSAPVSATPAWTAVPALFVVGNTTLSAADVTVRDLLQDMGYQLTLVKDSSALASDATGKAIVVISATVNPDSVNTKFRNAAVPVMLWEHDLYDDMMMTGGAGNHGKWSNSLSIEMDPAKASHPMAAGFTGVIQVASPNLYMTWGMPSSSAVNIANIPNYKTQKVIFGYSKGSAMVGMNAPARRVGFFFDDSTVSGTNWRGKNLFRAAVSWAAGGPAAPKVIAIAGTGKVTLQWEPVSGALSYTIRRGTSTGNMVTLARGISGTLYVDTTVANERTYYYEVVPFNDVGSGAASVALSVTPRAAIAPILGRIVGPPYLRSLPPNDSWSQATYTLEARYYDGTDWVLPLPTKTVEVTWSLIPHNAGGLPASNAIATLSNMSPTSVTLTRTGTEGAALLQAYVKFLNLDKSTFAYGFVWAEVKFTKRKSVHVKLRFPEDTTSPADVIHRTQRRDRNGNDNKFFEEDDPSATDPSWVRDRARLDYASYVAENIRSYWKNAGIDVYVMPDLAFRQETTNIPDDWFDETGAFIHRDSDGNATAGLTDLVNKRYTWAINIWLVKEIMGNTLGTTFGSRVRGPSRLTVVIEDDAPWSVFAHEMGHSFGNGDMSGWDNKVNEHGFINNRFLIDRTESYKWEFLMWGIIDENTNYYLSHKNSYRARAEADWSGILGAPGQDP